MQDELETQSFRENKGNYSSMPTMAHVRECVIEQPAYPGEQYGRDMFDPYRMPISPPNHLSSVNEAYRYDERPHLRSRGGKARYPVQDHYQRPPLMIRREVYMMATVCEGKSHGNSAEV